MSNKLITAAYAVSGVSMKAKSVLAYLADQVRTKDVDRCWPSQGTIAEATSMDERSVIRAIVELEDAGQVTVDRSNGRHSSYRVHPKPVTTGHLNPCQVVTGPSMRTSDNVTPTSDNVSGDPCQVVTGPLSGCRTNQKAVRLTSNNRRSGGGGASSSTTKTRTPLPEDFTPSEGLRAWCKREDLGDPELYLDHFKSWARTSRATAWNWDLTFSQAIVRDDAKIRAAAQKPWER